MVTQKSDVGFYVPERELITLWFYREGDVLDEDQAAESRRAPLFWADVRADLTFQEKQALQDAIASATANIEARLLEENAAQPEDARLSAVAIKRLASLQLPVEEIWNVLAPFVLDWSVGEIVDGKAVRIDPPAVAGGQQFQYISELYTTHIAAHLVSRSEGSVSMDFLGKSKPSARHTVDGRSDALNENG